MKIPVMIQMQNGENGATALCMMLRYYRRFVPLEDIREVCVSSRNGSSPDQIAQAASIYGLDAAIKQITAEDLRKETFPVMIQWKRRYYCLIQSIRGDIVTVADPASGVYRLTMDKLAQLFTGTAITFQKTPSFQEGGKQETLFDLIKERLRPLFRPMIVLLIFTLICVGANMAMMLMKQDIMDNAMGSAAAADGAFDAADYGFFVLFFYCLLMIIYTLFSIMKTRSVSSASRKISAGSGSLLFKKIFRQPLRFFEQYSGYELISRIESNITIDNSILKTLVPRVIDAGMSILYLILLFYYNAIISAVCVVLVILTLLASYRIQQNTRLPRRV